MGAFVYSLIAYVIFFVTFLYAIAFVENLPVPRTIDRAPVGALAASIIIDLLLLSLFAVQHSVMARPAFKRAWIRIVPPMAERSTYVLASSLALIVLFAFWRALPTTVWSVGEGPLAIALSALSYLGFALVLVSTFLIDHFELFGLRQGWASLRGEALPEPKFRTPLFYKLVRHPLYFGFLLAFWATPRMTAGHLLFAIATTGYMLLAIVFEERDLTATFGETYVLYRQRVSMIIPLPPRRETPPTSPVAHGS
ncbi:MAG: isoprenylcysteine carboxylmethyltransferase family protein [Caulobacteraceae bacterium]|nr:isoprenylcysteine carboxylmethyltransferase family protein [Caulobacteraceae bacterium]